MKQREDSMFEIKHYEKRFESAVMDIIKAEGEDWSCYWSEENAEKYKQALDSSNSYVVLGDGRVCGYSRSLLDNGHIYVFDLLVAPAYRGNQLGKKLLECLAGDYPGVPVYILSGNDEYYLKQGYGREGSIFLLNPIKPNLCGTNIMKI
jgi:GNAT superfamily N-acetyltransferase